MDMRLTTACFLAISLAATSVAADCDGRDIRPDLTATQAAELERRVAAYPFNRGNHWRATRGRQVIHVIGTVHIDDPRLADVLDKVAPTLRHADLLLVEGTEEQEAQLQRAMAERPGLAFITEGPTLPDLLPEPLWQDLSAAMRARGVPGFMAAKMQPWFLSVMLSLPACLMEGLKTGANGLDNRMIALARRNDVPVEALEPYDTLFRVMGSDPLSEQVDMLRLGILPEQVAEDSTATLLESYFEEETAEILEVGRLVAHDALDIPHSRTDELLDEMLENILDTRNLTWMERILDAPEGVTIVAVGAGHLPGDAGLLNLLGEAGFALERQPF